MMRQDFKTSQLGGEAGVTRLVGRKILDPDPPPSRFKQEMDALSAAPFFYANFPSTPRSPFFLRSVPVLAVLFPSRFALAITAKHHSALIVLWNSARHRERRVEAGKA